MAQEAWKKIIPHVVRDPAIATECSVVTLDASSDELARARSLLTTLDPRFSAVVAAVLADWQTDGADVLVEAIPRLLNPAAAMSDLMPTGKPTRDVFPVLYRMLQHTEDVAIIVDPAEDGTIELVGRIGQSIPVEIVEMWAYEAPIPIADVVRWEAEREIHLSPQLRQFYLCVGGARSNWVYPCFYRPQDMRRGSLFIENYRDILDQVPLSAAILDRMRQFVVLTDDGVGNSEGFFADEWQPDREYTIYRWDHQTTEFVPRAQDFAELVAEWLRPDNDA